MMADLGNLTTQPFIPRVQSNLRHGILEMPKAIYEASGIVINGRRIKSLVFTTDLAIIRNCDADAVFAVYPFTPQQAKFLNPRPRKKLAAIRPAASSSVVT